MIGDKIAILICNPRLGMTVFAEKWAYSMLRTSELQGHPAGVPPERVFVPGSQRQVCIFEVWLE